MYKIILHGVTKKNEYEELVKIFINPDEFVVVCDDDLNACASDNNENFEHVLEFDKRICDNKNLIKQEIYRALSKLTDYSPEWGIHTGVRPVKLAGELVFKLGYEGARKRLLDFYLLSERKADLILNTYKYQQDILGKSSKMATGVYIGIPFCPTRCLYCSFASNQVESKEIARYLKALHREINFVANEMKEKGYYAESMYIGGGTPTTLTAEQLESLLSHIEMSFDLSKLREFTVEAGRPDTIDKEKLQVIKNHDIGRISINPQTMKAHTLELIGRSHMPEDIKRAFTDADEVGIDIINADMIAGLPEETAEDFKNTLNEIIKLGAQNITVHTLAVKKASRLMDIDKNFHYKQGAVVKEQLKAGEKILADNGYKPYYLYRQKHMAGSFENVGYCKPGTEGIYNIRIMEEMQTIVALGAGGISKAYYPLENRLERVPNVTNYEIYIERLDEMLDRKRKNLLQEVNYDN